MGDSFSILAMLYYLFFNVNSLSYYSLSTINQALAIITRLSEVFCMEEYKSERKGIMDGKPLINLSNMEYAWGFRVATLTEERKAENKARLEVEDS